MRMCHYYQQTVFVLYVRTHFWFIKAIGKLLIQTDLKIYYIMVASVLVWHQKFVFVWQLRRKQNIESFFNLIFHL